jgi:hypothetical protein
VQGAVREGEQDVKDDRRQRRTRHDYRDGITLPLR